MILLQSRERGIAGHWEGGGRTFYSLGRPRAVWKRSVAKSRCSVILGSLGAIMSGSSCFGQLVQILANRRISRS